MKLFATDLDGTLLDREDGIHPRDFAAIERARERGVIVTIATGRLTSRTHPIARALRLDAPLVCADGGVLACSLTERILERRPLSLPVIDRALEVLDRHGLSRFIFTHDAIHSCERGRAHHAYVRGWAHAITAHAELHRAPAWRIPDELPVMVVGIGHASDIDHAHEALADLRCQLDIIVFDIADARVIRIMHKSASKGAALLALAEQLGVKPEDVAVAGDWYNDLSMFAVAGHSFAMPHAPPVVKAAAKHVLADDAPKRGAIAEALGRWLAELG